MRISISRGPGTSQEGELLTDYTRSCPPPSDFVETPSNLEQVATGLRWVDVEVYDRGNEETTIEFTVVRQHESTSDAEFFISERKAKLRGLWKFYMQSEAGKYGVRWLKNATVKPITLTYSGQQTTIRYRAHGGRIRNTLGDSQ